MYVLRWVIATDSHLVQKIFWAFHAVKALYFIWLYWPLYHSIVTQYIKVCNGVTAVLCQNIGVICTSNRDCICDSHTSYLITSKSKDTYTVYPKKYAHGFCFAVLCCSYTLTDFPISIRLTSLALWQSNDCPSASKATLMNMDKYFMWIHYERLHNHNKAKHKKTVCIFLGIYCTCQWR